MLSPKRVKFRKMFKGRTKGLATRGAEISFGTYGLQAMEPGWITNRQIEAARVALTRHIKRGGKVWIRIFPDKPITKKPAETRMGKAWPRVVRARGRHPRNRHQGDGTGGREDFGALQVPRPRGGSDQWLREC